MFAGFAFCFCFQCRISLCDSSGGPRTPFVDLADLELTEIAVVV